MLKTLFSIAFLLILIVVPSVNIYAIGGKVEVTAELPAHKADKFIILFSKIRIFPQQIIQ